MGTTDLDDVFSDDLLAKLLNLKDPISEIEKKPARLEPSEPKYHQFYEVPEDLMEILTKAQSGAETENALDKFWEFAEINTDNYASYFHKLLHMEEIEHIKQLKIYNCDRIMLRADGRCLVYDLPDDQLCNTQHLGLGKCFVKRDLNDVNKNDFI